MGQCKLFLVLTFMFNETKISSRNQNCKSEQNVYINTPYIIKLAQIMLKHIEINFLTVTRINVIIWDRLDKPPRM